MCWKKKDEELVLQPVEYLMQRDWKGYIKKVLGAYFSESRDVTSIGQSINVEDLDGYPEIHEYVNRVETDVDEEEENDE